MPVVSQKDTERLRGEDLRDVRQLADRDGRGDGCVLKQRNKVVAHGRKDFFHHDGQFNFYFNNRSAQTDGLTGLDDPLRDRFQSGAEHFLHVGGGIQSQRDDERGDLGDVDAGIPK